MESVNIARADAHQTQFFEAIDQVALPPEV
jgi:hypothetical protein